MASISGLLGSLVSSDSGAFGSCNDARVQMAFGDDRVSVRHRWCCGTLLSGRLTLLMRLRVCVTHGSILEPSTTFTEEARGAKAAAEAGNSCGGISGRSLWSKDNLR